MRNRSTRPLALFLLVAMVPITSSSADYLEEVESEVFETKGTAQEIANRARTCIAQRVRNDEVRITDNASSSGPFPTSTLASPGHSDGIEGGDVLVHADLEGGIVTANNRVDYKSKLLAHNVKSTLTFMAKEGRFKIRHSNIEYVQKSTGSMRNSGYSRVGKWFGSGWKDAEAALTAVTSKVAACVQSGPVAEDW